MKPLAGRVAVVAGATRGAGRGIACMLGEAGATVYCTGRSVRGRPATGNRPETIEETAEMVSARGGTGLHAQVDHTVEAQVKALFDRVRREQGGLDILVNDVWGGDDLTEWGTPFWKLTVSKGLTMLERAVFAHIITSRHGVPLMLGRGHGLLVEITDGDEEVNRLYRGNLFYDLAKISALRLAFAMAHELRDRDVTAVALTPGFLRSEAMLEHFGVTEERWRDGIESDPAFAESETPFYVGRAVVALACDPRLAERAGQGLSSGRLAREYGFTDVDGRRPDIGTYIFEEVGRRWERITTLVRETLGAEGPIDEAHERRRLELKVRLNPDETPPRWCTWPVEITEIMFGDPARVARNYCARYRRDREAAR